ncbi:MAG TPA: M48 family metalloprotease [Myxococcaceae bacterium]|jgi:Zn-dependent protease with chaperone function
MTGEDLSSLMPFWVRHFPILLVLAALPFSFLVTALAIRVSRSREPVPAEPWYARARALWPQMFVARQAQLVLPILLTLVISLVRGPVTATPTALVVALTFPLALLGTALATRAFLVSAGVRRSAGEQIRGTLAWLLVMQLALWLAFTGACVVAALQGTPRVVALSALMAGAAAAAAGMGTYVAHAVGLVSKARPSLVAAAEAAAAASGHHPRFVWEIDVPMANALALPWIQGVLVTRRLAEMAAPDEMEAILRHELGHLREPWAIRTARLALPVVGCWTLLLSPVVARDWVDLGLTLGWALALVVVALLLRRFALRMEHRADQELGEDHATYARALEKLYAENLVPAVIGSRRLTHPELYDRMRAAGHPPSWPRPDPPRRSIAGRVVLMLALVVPAEVALLPIFVPPRVTLNVRSEWDVVGAGASRGHLFGVARGWLQANRREESRALLLALAGEDTSELAGFSAAGILAEGGFCQDARHLTDERGLLRTDSEWRGWLQERLDDCSDGRVFVRETPE